MVHQFLSSGHFETQSLHSQKVLKWVLSHDCNGRATSTSTYLLGFTGSRLTLAAVSGLHLEDFTGSSLGAIRSAMSRWSSTNWRRWIRIGSFNTRQWFVPMGKLKNIFMLVSYDKKRGDSKVYFILLQSILNKHLDFAFLSRYVMYMYMYINVTYLFLNRHRNFHNTGCYVVCFSKTNWRGKEKWSG